MAHQLDAERGTDEGAATEAHDGQAGRHARPVGKPFDKSRDRRDVAEAQANASDDAVTKVEQPDVMDGDAQAGHPKAPAEAKGTGEKWSSAVRRVRPTGRGSRPRARA